ncbi:hypothetical protein, partial [Enterococcus casseliflavus]|uniref:hypothetical protein n=1 Tax=Enterococcus casseliflavus TaxID=37734 RepID=UPI003D0E70F0
YAQNELHQVEPGNKAEFALPTHPGRIFKGTVDSVVWEQGVAQARTDAQGAIAPATALTAPPGGFAVKFNLADPVELPMLAAGASGD